MPPDPSRAWAFLPWGYLATIVIELPVLVIGLAPRHDLSTRLLAGVALTAFTYPIVICVLPPLAWAANCPGYYVPIAELFAAGGECLLFLAAFGREGDRRSTCRDAAAIVAANLLSFGLGEAWHAWR